jgi:RNA polymerase sigma-70 factor (ECF subfamily)
MAAENTNTILLQQLQQGSVHAFTAIYDLFSKPLYRNILRMVKDEAIAEELLQDLFFKLWVKRHDLDTEKPLKPYLYKIGASLVYKHFRKEAQDQRLINQLIIDTVDHATDAEQAVIDKEMQTLLGMAIAQLSPQRKQVFTLCKLEGKSYSEVGAVLGTSNETVKDHIVKANKAIRHFFLHNPKLLLALFAFYLSC